MKVLEFVAFVGAVFVLGVAALCLSAYVVMLYVGMWHGHNAAVPALGFVDCLYGVGLVGLLTAAGARVTRD